ncbi:MAG: hypothetical protein FJ320_03390 [SAR202 cluster bacterium]|nr:hypothetical protein [SAR202 cluster bacterium]
MTTNANRIRQVTLLAGEKTLAILDPKDGLIPKASERGGLLVLTSRRLVTFTELEGRKETRTIPLEKVEDVCIRTSKPSTKPLLQGASLLLAAFIVAFVLSAMTDQPNEVAILLGLAIALLGVLFIGRYFAWEQGGELTVSLGPRDVSFSLETERSIEQSYEVVNGINRARAGEPVLEAEESPEVNVELFSGMAADSDDQPLAPVPTEPSMRANEPTPSQSTERDPRPSPDGPLGPGSVESSRTPQP